jgi:uncharacterized protein (TIGR04442 family)
MTHNFQEIWLHGHLDDTIEYYAMTASPDAYSRYFFQASPESLRIFSPGNELILGLKAISHHGNGGSFCEYMFGVDQPLPDLAKSEVLNRLILYGTYYKDDGTHLDFTSNTSGQKSYEQLFFEGNATVNYFFFVNGLLDENLEQQQETVARALGKTLKRSKAVGERNDTALLYEICHSLGPKMSLSLVKLIHKKHRLYHEKFKSLYFQYKTIPDYEFKLLQELADELNVDKYQQERIRIDIMYKHPDNQRVVDEYKNILIDCNIKGTISPLENARLTRLKTLSVRNKIPSALFYTLDKMLKYEKLLDIDEQDSMLKIRQVLQGIFLAEANIDVAITAEDMSILLYAKKQASENRDPTFDQILLETGKACDEKVHQGADLVLLENFSYIITYFDRYDNTASVINQLAFMENFQFGEGHIRSLLGNKQAFNELHKDLWTDLFFSPVLKNKYLGRFGRKKVMTLHKGLALIEGGLLTIKDLDDRLRMIGKEEKLYLILLEKVKEKIKNFYSKYNTREEQETLLVEIADELYHKDIYTADIPVEQFQNVIVNIKKEAIYLHNLLPKIITERDIALREDFLDNSGLDRFYVEELEREYFQLNSLDIEDLYLIRKGLAD